MTRCSDMERQRTHDAARDEMYQLASTLRQDCNSIDADLLALAWRTLKELNAWHAKHADALAPFPLPGDLQSQEQAATLQESRKNGMTCLDCSAPPWYHSKRCNPCRDAFTLKRRKESRLRCEARNAARTGKSSGSTRRTARDTRIGTTGPQRTIRAEEVAGVSCWKTCDG